MIAAKADQAAIGIVVDLSEQDTVVRLDLDATPYLAQLRLRTQEVRRRQTLSLGAVTSTGLLHALWNIPVTGIPANDLSERDRRTLMGADGLVVEQGGILSRLYQPPGEVLLLGARRTTPNSAIARALQIPPVFQRVAMWSARSRPTQRDAWLFRLALRNGLGMIEFDETLRPSLIQAPTSPAPGTSAVYRWFVAEIAFRSWLQAQTAHASS